MESPENHSEGSLVVSFLFYLEPNGNPACGCRSEKEEGDCGCGTFAFGKSGTEQASSDAAAVLFFLKEEKEKNGGAKWRADVGIGPYNFIGSADEIGRSGRTESSAPTSSIARKTNGGQSCPPLQTKEVFTSYEM